MKAETLQGFRLSPQQKHLWQSQQNNRIRFAQAAIKIAGAVDLQILQTAIQKVVDRQEILRTNFNQRSGISIPLQVIAESNKISWHTIDFFEPNPENIEQKLGELCCSEKVTDFNYECNSPLRLLLVTLNHDLHYLIITLPSLYADSQTINNLVQEISQSYDLCLQGKDFSEEPIQYIQFSEWQNELSTEGSPVGQDYWQKQSQDKNSLFLPGELNSNQNQRIESSIYSLVISPELTDKVITKYQSNLSNFLRVCWYILLSKLTNESEILVSNLFAGRKYTELANTLGLLAQFLPVSCTVSKQFTVQEILSNLEHNLIQAEKYQEYYLGIGAIRESPLLIGFEFDKLPSQYNVNNVSFSISQKDIHLENFKLKLTCKQQQDCLITEFHYDAQNFAAETIALLAQQFHTLVASAIANPEATVEELNILDSQQRHQLLVEFNNNKSNYPQDKSIHQLFESQVSKTPNSIAVIYNSEQLTYSELNQKANQLANYLRQKGVTPQSLVGLYLERSHFSIIGLLAILKAGAAYLPLDAALPTEGLTFRLQDAEVSILLTQRSLITRIPKTIPETISLDSDWETIAKEDHNNPQHQTKPENLAYAIYTSGSTGTPKAVAIAHKQLVNYVYAIRERFNLSSGASFATVSTFAADLGNTMLFPALCTGGCLHIIPQEIASDPQAFNNYCQSHPIDYLKIVPSHLSALLASSATAEFLPRKQLILGGEASNWQLITKIQQHKPNCQIFNHYGPTETTVGVLTYQVETRGNGEMGSWGNGELGNRLSSTVPVGKPLANNQVYILDEQLQPVPLGVPGELYIGGAQVSQGYLNRLELTQEKFINNPFSVPKSLNPPIPQNPNPLMYRTGDRVRYLPALKDTASHNGNIEFLGRIDRQVKIRGFRIELGEIENKLQQHPGIESAVVIASRDERLFDLENKRLIAYVVTNHQFRLLHQNQNQVIASELRSFCIAQFPEYMIPSAFVVLKTMPLTANGKIDYQALPTTEQTRPELEQLYIEPRSPLEKQLAEIWTEVLGLEKIGINDDFFELGGHSLLITQLLAKVRNTFQVELPLKDLFNAPTIADLAKRLGDGETREIRRETTIDLNSEAVLDPQIVPGDNSFDITTTPKNILITGATGFLGAFLLNELLQKTTAKIYCLIRAKSITHGQQRIAKKLKSYLLWNESFRDRIMPIVGDLSQPFLGLSTDRFSRLAETIDVIYHNGAWVNFTYPYSQLKAANVLGTEEILRLAIHSKVKPVHFISTIGVVTAADRQLEIISEDTPIEHCEQIPGGYTQSKWVAEKLIAIARDRGIPTTIYRPGRISGHSQTGACNPDDHTFRMIRGCIQMGTVPQDDSMINLTPVDYAVSAIAHLSNQPESLGKTFHLVNPQPTPWNEVVNSVIDLGYPLRQIEYTKWREKLLEITERSPNHPLSPLISTFAASATSQKNTEEAISQELVAINTNSGLTGTEIVCPQCDRNLLSTYFSYLSNKGLLTK
ncbi:amino acid adenylation enzyme/thioester reductase family protein [Xenococcus sp. PCC 7305]|uniref:non-ribosomal peptide synthetase family protein n=1 Tax=Xenococcus sp. PCC 7305 TaxID=102125 RepID=UPI0002AC9AC1|nr:non-ribosomal peptide synthetase [Xenococcus sp. PCC 7305]ELS00500.1 amino acid adenylation enzyme/thioester reductase family protein [Xenococcus sp. PCC 7305]